MHIGYNRIVGFMEKYQILCFSVFIITAIVISNFLLSGIVINDELQTNLLRKNGLLNVLLDSINAEFIQGRGARNIGGLLRLFPVISTNYEINRFIQIMIILSTSIMFTLVIYKCFYDKFFALFNGILSFVALPMTFEQAPPEAHIGYAVIPVFLCLLSLYLHICFIETKKMKYRCLSLIIFFVSITCYEFMVSTFLLHYILLINKNKLKFLSKGSFMEFRWYIVLTIIYCVIYLIIRLLFSPNYAGTQFGELHDFFITVLAIIKSSFPGYYLISEKYLYLLQLYEFDFFRFHGNKILLNFVSLKSFFSFISMYIIIMTCIKNTNRIQENQVIKKLIFLLLQIFLLALPIGISQLYQDAVLSGDGILIHPVNYFILLLFLFIGTSILWNIIHKYRQKLIISIFVSIFLSTIISGIQGMNAVFAEQEARNYSRLQTIQEMLSSEIFLKHFSDKNIYAPDLYKTMNGLGFHDGYWTSYMNIKENSHTSINKVKKGEVMIFDEGNNIFTVVSKEKIIIFSLRELQDSILIHTGLESAMIISTKKQHKEKNLFILEKENIINKI